MVIQQGDVYWVDLGDPLGSKPGHKHPHVVVQNDLFNSSLIRTVVVVALTSNLHWADAPGNVLLKPGEANLPRQSVVNVTQIFTVDKRQLEEKIGSLSSGRVRSILDGIQLVLEPRNLEP
ncbi:MAG: type II toxin-antitoxin system PemK/MazF family toxin [Anaerolineae bacterium]